MIARPRESFVNENLNVYLIDRFPMGLFRTNVTKLYFNKPKMLRIPTARGRPCTSVAEELNQRLPANPAGGMIRAGLEFRISSAAS